MSTTPPQELARALAQWRLPAPLVISLLLVWRFFPVMREEVCEIRQANLLRGKGPNGKEWYRGFLLPLSFILLEYSDRVALALELRAYDPTQPRTWYRLPVMHRADWVFLGSAALVLFAAIFWEMVGCPA